MYASVNSLVHGALEETLEDLACGFGVREIDLVLVSQ